MKIGNKEVNEVWVASKTQTEFLEYALTNWAKHSDMQGKKKKQQTDYLKAIYKQCREAIGETIPIEVEPDTEG